MPASENQKCFFCGKYFYRSSTRVNENKKRGWKAFCSPECLSQFKNKQRGFVCTREGCGRRVMRAQSDLRKCKNVFCSHRCAAIVSNIMHPRNPGVIKICAYCGKNFKSKEKYCSTTCKHLGQAVPGGKLLGLIKKFEKKNGRIPYKNELGHYSAIRGRFGTWNKAIVAAGFKPNPVRFARQYIAKDGDRCDSLAEMIIDNYLSRRNIKHIKNFPYPGNGGFTVDFKIGDTWVEFFGLSGQVRRYDLLKKRKLRLAKKLGISLIKLYPKDLFPVGKLEQRLNFL